MPSPRLRLLGRRLVALDATGKAHEFRLGIRADGRLRLSATGLLPSRRAATSYVLALDPAIVFQRAIRELPRRRTDLVQLARDLFPFPSETTAYAIATDGADGLSCVALPTADLDRVTAEWPKPTAIVIATANPAALEQALAFRLDHGQTADLLSAPHRLVGPAPLMTAGLAAAAILATIALAWSWDLYQTAQDRALRSELAALEAEAAPVIRQREAILRIVPALKSQAAFSTLPSAAQLALLERILPHLPPGSAIDQMELKPDGLVLVGQSADQAGWLSADGEAPADLKLETLPKTTRFTARFSQPPAIPVPVPDSEHRR